MAQDFLRFIGARVTVTLIAIFEITSGIIESYLGQSKLTAIAIPSVI